MCGIVAYLGKKSAQPILVEGLKRLEYRGYDSAGVALLSTGAIKVKKTSSYSLGNTRGAQYSQCSSAFRLYR